MGAQNITVNISLAGEIDMDKICQEFDKAVRAEIDRVGFNVEFGAKASEIITHEGVEYKRVNRKAQEGDVVVFTETDSAWVNNHTPYVVGENLKIANEGWNVYNPLANRTESNAKVYEPVEGQQEEPLKVGDYAKVTNSLAIDGEERKLQVGDIYKIINLNHGGLFPLEAVRLRDGQLNVFRRDAITRATDEEVAEAKRQQAEAKRWAKIGRKPNEFKKGDIVSTENYGIVEVTRITGGDHPVRGYFSSNKESGMMPGGCTLVVPVEQRLDLDGGDGE
jgi:hypothetical protein